MKRPKKIAPKGQYRVIGFDFFEPAAYGPAEWTIKDCKTLAEAKVVAKKEDSAWTAARVYDDSGKECFVSRSADLI